MNKFLEGNMYKLIALDLDGTLLNSYGEISAENKKAIQYALDKGVNVILASGRDPQTMRKISLDLGIHNYLIAGNGASIYDIQQDENIYERYIPQKKALKIIQMCKENTIFFNVYTDKGIITESLNYNVKVFNSENTHKPEEKQTNIEIVTDIYEYVKNTKLNILKIIICDDSQIIFNNIIHKMKKISGIHVLDVEHMSKKMMKIGTEEVEVEYFYTEVSRQDVDKWNAIEHLLSILGIQKEEVICIGDNVNDKIMVENAGLGIAMGNSALALQKIGDETTKSNNEDGVAMAIYKHLQ